MKKQYAFLALLLAVVVGVYFYTDTATVQHDEIVIGAVLHLTGDQAEPARAFREGIELAADGINKRGGIDGKPVRLVIEDDKLQPKEAYSAAKKLIEIDAIDAAIDASFLEIMANGALFNDAHTPVMVLWDSSKSIEDIGPYVFGIGIWTPSAGEESATFARNDLHARTAIVINIQNEWSQAVSTYFTDAFEKQGGRVVETHTLAPGTTDFRTIIAKAKASGADILYAPVTDGVVPFYKQLRQLGFDKPIVTSDIVTAEHIAVDRSAFEGVYQTQAQDPSSPETVRMQAKYRTKYGRDAQQILFTAWGYDAMYILADAIDHVGTDGEKVSMYLHSQVKDYSGASGTISIDERGSSPKMESIFQIRDGGFVLVE
jgi:branched-chain amino acid transport system substrate-binding protein